MTSTFPIQIKNASFGYDSHLVFKNISLNINHSEIFCLMGQNGCGKSTMIDTLLNIHKLSEGNIFIMEKDLKKYTPSTLAKRIAYIPQTYENSFPYTVKQVILMGRTIYTGYLGHYSKKDCEIVDDTMKHIGIFHLAERPYTQISGGEMQMVMLARALVQQTDIVIMDEPTAHLDYYNELLFLENVIRLTKEEKKTVFMATHSPNQPFFMEKSGVPIRVGLMKDGNIICTGTPSEILTEDNVRTVYNIESHIINSHDFHTLIPVRTI